MALGLMWRIGLVGVVAAYTTATAIADNCSLRSPAHRVSVLELYTSEGCNSCPPADRWLSGLPRHGVSAQNAVVLAFHVDYWNELGWPDRFSQPAFSQRQRVASTRSRTGAIYTPQVILDGNDLRGAYYKPQDLQTRLTAINRQAAGATIQAEISRNGNDLRIAGATNLVDAGLHSRAHTWIAVFESGLSSQVKAGENAGRQLYHDFVVRELIGPLKPGEDGRTQLAHGLRMDPAWRSEQLGIAVFVQRDDTGEILQATALQPLSCKS